MQKDMENRKNEMPVSRPAGMIYQIVLSSVSILLGALLLFVPDVGFRLLCTILCGALIAAGVGGVAVFFLSKGYLRLRDYRFALGVLLLILGCCGLLRIDEMTEAFTFYMGLVALILSVILLQETVQLRVLKNRLWAAALLLTIVTLTGSTLVLVNPAPILTRIPEFPCWVLFLVGICSLIGLLFAVCGVRHAEKGGPEPGSPDSSMEYPEGPKA